MTLPSDHVALETLPFVEQDGKTTLTSTLLFEPVEDRDRMLQSGMEGGAGHDPSTPLRVTLSLPKGERCRSDLSISRPLARRVYSKVCQGLRFPVDV
ncbi:MAG: hypothetical protein ACRD2A_00730 [Vicinamibacterales bacterium]